MQLSEHKFHQRVSYSAAPELLRHCTNETTQAALRTQTTSLAPPSGARPTVHYSEMHPKALHSKMHFKNTFTDLLFFCRLEKQQSHGEAYCRCSAAMPKHPNLNKMGHDLSKLNNQCLGFQWYVAVRLKFQQTAYPCTVSVWRVPSGRLEKHA